MAIVYGLVYQCRFRFYGPYTSHLKKKIGLHLPKSKYGPVHQKLKNLTF